MSAGKKLPVGWSWATLGDVTDDTVELKGPEGDGNFIYVDIGSIDNQEKKIVDPKFLPIAEAPSRAKQQLKPGDVLVSMTRPNLNAVAMLSEDMTGAIGSTGFHTLRTNWISSAWLYYAVQTNDFISAMSGQVKGALYPAIRPKNITSYSIPIPPLAEQYRIVDEIESRFIHLESVVQALKRILINLERLNTSILKAAYNGQLLYKDSESFKTDEHNSAEIVLAQILSEHHFQWENSQLKKMHRRGKTPKDEKWKTKYKPPTSPALLDESKLPKGWTWATLDQLSSFEPNSITDGPFGSNLKSEHYTDAGARVIRLQNVGDGIFHDVRTFISYEHFYKLSKHQVYAGDLVIAALGEKLPRCCIVPTFVGDAIVKADCIRYKPNIKIVSAQYLNIVLNAEPTRTKAASVIHGVGRPRLNLGEIKAITIPVPPLAEQKRIVAEVDRRLSVIRKIESVVQINLKRAEVLRQKILQSAFSGKLLPQNPSDEPASDLLEKIRNQKDDNKTQILSKKKTGKSKKAKNNVQAENNQGSLPFEQLITSSKGELKDMKLLKLKLDDDYKSLHKFDHIFRSIEAERQYLSPVCLVGLNGSGKSNLIESLSEIFCYLELINLPYESIVNRHRETNLRFELEYLLPTENSDKYRQIRIIKYNSSEPKFLDITHGIENEIVGHTAQLNALPTRIIGYSSGLNETINIPFFKTKALYSKDVYERARKKSKEPVEDSRTLFMDYDSNAAILIANYIFEPEESYELFNRYTRIERISSFEIVVQLKRPGKEPVELTQELKDSIDKLKNCAHTSKYDKKRDKSTFTYVINQDALKIFREIFRDAKDFFKTVHRLSLLNALALGKREREFYLREGLKEGLLEPPPTVSTEDKIFSINRLRLMLSDPQKEIDYAGISDGEHQFMHVLGTVKLFDEPGVIFLLDEPETHFNPRWRREFVQLLEKIDSAKHQEFVISTHSPFIVSGCRKENVFKFERKRGIAKCYPVEFETYGASFEFLLTQLFDLDALISESALEELKQVIKSDDVEELEAAINQFGESFEKRFLFEKIAKLKKTK